MNAYVRSEAAAAAVAVVTAAACLGCAETPAKTDAPPTTSGSTAAPAPPSPPAPVVTASVAGATSRAEDASAKASDVTAEQRAAVAKELEAAIVPFPPLVATPPPPVAAIIDKAAAPLLRHPTLVAEVGGHAADDELEEVAWARANLVASSLAARGVGRERLVVKTYGKRTPRAQGTTDDARAKNRRVEIKLVDPLH